jgi:hypothetical protein
VKAELTAKLNTNGLRYENEYSTLSELTALLVDVRDASISLRPVVDLKDPNKSDDETKRERLLRLWEAGKLLYTVREKSALSIQTIYINQFWPLKKQFMLNL